ncbi:MAG: N-acylglucosamine 2-epimerase [Bacteroidetes bacterium]|jgi:N-acylglucosamine 2-epimerase|nr:N-acylglucosamine 2-epimerase [Bacteroidota bacterium]
MTPETMQQYRQIYEEELFERVLPFWVQHSPDRDHGGYFNCLDRDGTVYDTRKHIWLQGRQVWLFSRLYNNEEKRPEWLSLAKRGADFLDKHAVRDDHRAYFSLTRTGDPLWMQRKIFSECFCVMAFAEYGRASGNDYFIDKAHTLFNQVWQWKDDLSLVGRPSFSGQPATRSLAIPMILLNLIEVLAGDDWPSWRSRIDHCIENLLLHVDEERELVFEHVSPGGECINTIEGRLLNPGHAIEAGWFMLHWALRLGDESLQQKAVQMTRWSLERGWDYAHGGIFYFLDSEGFSPTELEWNMKLWWPHTEALYACLLNYSVTGSERDLRDFEKVHNYTFSHFPDHKYGEWFGYLDRRGDVSQRFKGGPYKGCFHAPRSLFQCVQLLRRLEAQPRQ